MSPEFIVSATPAGVNHAPNEQVAARVWAAHSPHTTITLLHLRRRLADIGAVLVRHGSFIGVRGPVRLVSLALWDAIRAHEPALRRLLPSSASPYRQWRDRRVS
jgi:hypothetical protein